MRGMTRMSSPLTVPVLQADSKIEDYLFQIPEDCFWGVEKFSFLASPGISCESSGESESWEVFNLSFLLMVEFQWFLMELSVRPGSNLAIRAHLFPNLNDSSFTVCEPKRWFHLLHRSNAPCRYRDWGDCAIAICTACLYVQEVVWRCSSSF